MKITDMEVRGFGVWSNLQMAELPEDLIVFFGPNEAGKTTLMQFIRTVLYGFSADRCRRYLPPVHGGTGGGAVQVETLDGPMRIERGAPSAPGDPGTVRVIMADGTEQGQSLLQSLLSGIDEAIFNNVFAVGLRDLQELGTLEDTQAAEHLYKLTTGLDRVALVEVIQELQQSRERLLSASGQGCQISELLARRARVRQEINTLAQQAQQWVALRCERSELQDQISRQEQELKGLERQANLWHLALELQETFDQRQKLHGELSALPALPPLPPDPLGRLQRLSEAIAHYGRRRRVLQQQRKQLRLQTAQLSINRALCRQAARIEALGEQAQWAGALEGQIQRLDEELQSLERRLETDAAPALPVDARNLPPLSAKQLGALRLPGEILRDQSRRLKLARQEQQSADRELEEASGKLESVLLEHDATDLHGALAAAGQRVSLLRRRVQVDERLERMARHRSELQEQSSELLQRQVLPLGVLVGVGTLFVLGVLLLLLGLFGVPLLGFSSGTGWAMALLGVAGTGVAVAAKLVLERTALHRLEACNKQLELLTLEIEQAKQEREAMDQQIPAGGGPLSMRLTAAESELRQLEELVPLQAQQDQARRQGEATQSQVNSAQRSWQEARRRWVTTLRPLGLPPTLTPRHIKALQRRARELDDIQQHLQIQREELAQRRRELGGLADRVQQLLADAGITPVATSVVQQLRQLTSALAQQQQQLQRRTSLRNQDHRLLRRQKHYLVRLRKVKRLRRELLTQAGVADENALRRLVERHMEAEQLRQQHKLLEQRIDVALAGSPQQEVAQLVRTERSELEQHAEQLSLRLKQLQQELAQARERTGAIRQEMKTLAQDRRLDLAKLELSVTEAKLRQTIHRWQILATTLAILEHLRQLYETERQPEALQEASAYLQRITEGQYERIWTPLSRQVLLVQNQQGESLPLEVLSRGTREAVFVSLRLALASAYARRSALLPLVMDDVLVNFDAKRAKATATVLREFARRGHQLLLFTCHEHILKVFKAAKAEIRHLPTHAADGEQIESQEREQQEEVEQVVEQPEEAEEVEELAEGAEKVEEQYAESPGQEELEHAQGATEVTQRRRPSFTWSSPEMWWEDDEAA